MDIMQLFWLFFVLPLPPFNVEMSPFAVAIVGLGLHIGAYGAEVMRGAISSVATEFCVQKAGAIRILAKKPNRL